MTDQLIDFISMDGNEELLASIEAVHVKKKRKTITLDQANIKAIEQLRLTVQDDEDHTCEN